MELNETKPYFTPRHQECNQNTKNTDPPLSEKVEECILHYLGKTGIENAYNDGAILEKVPSQIGKFVWEKVNKLCAYLAGGTFNFCRESTGLNRLKELWNKNSLRVWTVSLCLKAPAYLGISLITLAAKSAFRWIGKIGFGVVIALVNTPIYLIGTPAFYIAKWVCARDKKVAENDKRDPMKMFPFNCLFTPSNEDRYSEQYNVEGYDPLYSSDESRAEIVRWEYLDEESSGEEGSDSGVESNEGIADSDINLIFGPSARATESDLD